MKRLFIVVDSKAKHHDGQFFDTKQAAKTLRDALIVEHGVNYHVSIGPDHIGYHGMKKVPRMRRQPKHTRKTT